jgi:hypothetical protein
MLDEKRLLDGIVIPRATMRASPSHFPASSTLSTAAESGTCLIQTTICKDHLL